LDDRYTLDTPVLVEVVSMGTPVSRTYTDSSGRVVLHNLSTGSYTANISGPDIQPTSISFSIDFARMQTITASVHRADSAQENIPAGFIDASELNAPKNAHKEYEKGVHEFTDRHYDKAEQHFRKAVAEYPKYSSAWNNIGSIRLQANDLAGAEECYRHALEANPNNNFAARNLARLLINKKNTKEAEQIMKHAIVTEPTRPESLTILAYTELQNGEFDDAIATAKRVHTGPSHGGALSHLIAARALEMKRQNTAAIAEYPLFLKEAPKAPQAKVAEEALARLGANQEAAK
jgi:predicted Zn-dependent protease